MSLTEFCYIAAGTIIGSAGIVTGIYFLSRCAARSWRRHREAALRVAKIDLLTDTAIKRLQLDMAAFEAMNRMDSVVSEYKEQVF